MPQHPALIETADAPAKLYLFSSSEWSDESAASDIPAPLAALAKANAFKASAGQLVVRADEKGAIVDVLGGLGAGTDGLAVAALSANLPEADYRNRARLRATQLRISPPVGSMVPIVSTAI